MTVRIDEMTHMPASTELAGSATPTAGAAAKPLTPPQVLALIRREAERRERVGAG